MESETRGSRPVFLRLKRAFPSADQDAITFTTYPDGAIGIRVARCAKLGASSKALISPERVIGMSSPR
jgi:hypothetical protein